jgi:hypothetical protein
MTVPLPAGLTITVSVKLSPAQPAEVGLAAKGIIASSASTEIDQGRAYLRSLPLMFL